MKNKFIYLLFLGICCLAYGGRSQVATKTADKVAGTSRYEFQLINKLNEPQELVRVQKRTQVETQVAASRTKAKVSRSANRYVARAQGVSQSIRDCIANKENGGSYGRSSNPTHFGRYQFDRGTWVEFGGSAQDWGTASAQEQDRVFNNAMNAGASSRWTPYDPC